MATETQMNEEQLKEWTLERVKYWTDFFRRIFPPAKNTLYSQQGTQYPTTTFSNTMRTTAGLANGYNNRVKFNTNFLFKLGKDFERTIAHEVAHVVADQHRGNPCKHGPVWKSVMAVSGLGNKRCHNYDCKHQETVLWSCPKCTRHFGCGKGRLTYLTNHGGEITCQCGQTFDLATVKKVLATGKHEPWQATVSTSSNCISDWCKKKVVL